MAAFDRVPEKQFVPDARAVAAELLSNVRATLRRALLD
jgi:hypothetical protein